MKELMFLNELILTNQINQKNYWYFKENGYKHEQYVCNGYHDLSMMVYDLDDFMILNIKGFDYRCFMFKMSKNDAIKLLNNFLLDNKDIL